MAEKKSSRTRAERGAAVAEQETVKGGAWKASPEAKSKALKLRIFAAVLWIIAIAAELFTIFWVLKQDPINIWLLIGLIVGIGVFALGGSFLWKKANRYDPASKKDKVRFFIQNQLGVIITIIAFLPLIVMIFLNKDMDGKQKGIVGGVAIAIAVIVGLGSWDWNTVSQEQYSTETNIVMQLTGVNEVVWVKGGAAFHVCEDVPDLRKSTKEKHHTTVEEAHAAKIPRLTKKWVSEAINNCGIPAQKVDAVLNGVEDATSTLDEGQFTTDADGKTEVAPNVAPAPGNEPNVPVAPN